MSLFTKIAGVAAGVSCIAVLGVAVAQGQPPNPLIPNHAIGAGQQSTHVTPMGETGVLAWIGETRTATLTKEAEPVAAAPAPAEPVAAAPAPAPEPVAAAPAPEPATTTMGAGPAEEKPMRTARADRN
ncbi:MAG TPA: hypothetical protein VNT59_17940 [Ramlibacter sp.]|nr:hypothetical protein [Ramlibacter sp.]